MRRHSFQQSHAATSAIVVRPRWNGFWRPLGNACCLALAFALAYGQQVVPAPDQADHPETIDKHAFGFLPNYRTTDASQQYQPVSPKEKMAIAAKDSFDWTLSLVAAGYAGLGQLTNQNPSFGQGLKGYGNRFVRAYSDQVLGNMLTEGVMPSHPSRGSTLLPLGPGNILASS